MWPKRSKLLAPLSMLLYTKIKYNGVNMNKKPLMQLSVMTYPSFNWPLDIHTDTSYVQLGTTISQAGKPIAYYLGWTWYKKREKWDCHSSICGIPSLHTPLCRHSNDLWSAPSALQRTWWQQMPKVGFHWGIHTRHSEGKRSWGPICRYARCKQECKVCRCAGSPLESLLMRSHIG